jgi:PTH1 family peptidyl-tRNA hydrolase
VEAVRYYDINPSDVIIIFDDAALPFGKLRYRSSGSAGGQKGMISILGGLGTLDVPRLRVGIDHPGAEADMKGWVLGKFTKNQRDAWPEIEELAWKGLERWLAGEAGEGFTVQITDFGDSGEGKKGK